MRTLASLLQDIVPAERWSSAAERGVAGVFDDSRQVQPSGLFVAVRGAAADGHEYAAAALQRGARVLIGEALPDSLRLAGAAAPGADPPLILNVPDSRETLGLLAARWHAIDAASGCRVQLLAVTGTNGKSTTTYMTQAILHAAGLKCGLLGTVHYDLCGRTLAADMTTPGPLQLAGYIRECVDAGAAAVALEVSSHALDQRRAAGLDFAAAAFTNLTQDHLDYHKMMDDYAAAKARLFAGLSPDAVAVVNGDDPWHARMLQACRARVQRFGLRPQADIAGVILRDALSGTRYRVRIDGQTLTLLNAMVGRHNVYNALTAIGLARAAGAPLTAIEGGLAALQNVPGRLQRVPLETGFEVFVDYAHTPDAIRNVLRVLRPLCRGRLMIVFGCGGDRDRGKRPLMAQAAAELADCILVTSDNPRSEDPQAIIAEVLTGFDDKARRRVCVEPDRRQAIFAALAGAHPGDVLLIAGKGHENYQIVGGERRHFDDVETAVEAAAQWNTPRRSAG
jgi:UDP-N-acetylmuramoyl-L-alanyl-D-glutamate--2,6-diaminopimelate ligase